MQAQTHAPASIFGSHVRYVVPIFQRPYVWDRPNQWDPLWEDVRALTEKVLEGSPAAFGAQPVPPHFLGAVVLDQQMIPAGFIGVRHVVDGQQRLTTLQLLLDAAHEVVEAYGASMDAQALRVLVLNDPQIAQHPDEVFKVWPTRRDQDAFRAAMTDGIVVPAELRSSLIAEAHAFFVQRISAWAEVTGDPEKVAMRLNALVRALRDHLKVVVIDLEPGDNAQVIFETLNHRGSPLLAADLVKNLLFQVAEARGLDVEHLYDSYWKPFDGQEWRKPVAQGRLYRPRIDVFLNYWLVMRLRREVPSDRIFAEFRDTMLGQEGVSVDSLLDELARDAAVFDAMDKLPQTSVEGKFHYRVIKALDTATVTPVLLWLLRWSEDELPSSQRHRALEAIESWLVRRTLARLTSAGGVNSVMLDLLRHLHEHRPAVAGEATESFLAEQSASSRFWPSDAVVAGVLRDLPVYTGLVRARLRMILETLEDDLRSDLGEGEPCPRGLTVEHVMPRAWSEFWPLSPHDESKAIRRDLRVHRLGNLTLVSGRLNPTMSNRPWTAEEAQAHGLTPIGKRDYLLEHSNLKLNARLVSSHPERWTDEDIEDRTESMVARMLAMWPRPEISAEPDAGVETTTAVELGEEFDQIVEDSVEDEAQAAPSHEGKYRDLWRWLREQERDEVSLTFSQIEEILGFSLPSSSRNHEGHWYGYEGTAVGRAIRDAGWRARNVDLLEESIIFTRMLAESSDLA